MFSSLFVHHSSLMKHVYTFFLKFSLAQFDVTLNSVRKEMSFCIISKVKCCLNNNDLKTISNVRLENNYTRNNRGCLMYIYLTLNLVYITKVVNFMREKMNPQGFYLHTFIMAKKITLCYLNKCANLINNNP